ncbi:hypothetical protein N656DRAFT_394932 [Canariomyces notabilis]|uniref:Uncharacterized protein n=1 Tax=Canariomyces notabilis TaxID=2074819 RepID=A0AAN6YW52_9PEZI|nr:hypothetical protein N656DRAFT_394932 [Canariomyces arenarius]
MGNIKAQRRKQKKGKKEKELNKTTRTTNPAIINRNPFRGRSRPKRTKGKTEQKRKCHPTRIPAQPTTHTFRAGNSFSFSSIPPPRFP